MEPPSQLYSISLLENVYFVYFAYIYIYSILGVYLNFILHFIEKDIHGSLCTCLLWYKICKYNSVFSKKTCLPKTRIQASTKPLFVQVLHGHGTCQPYTCLL